MGQCRHTIPVPWSVWGISWVPWEGALFHVFCTPYRLWGKSGDLQEVFMTSIYTVEISRTNCNAFTWLPRRAFHPGVFASGSQQRLDGLPFFSHILRR